MALACAIAVPTLLARPVAAFTPASLTLSSGSPTSGGPGTSVTYQYAWNATDCGVPGDSLTIQLYWDKPDPSEMIGTGAADSTCSGSVTGVVPNDTTRGDTHFPSAALFDNTTGTQVANSGAVAGQGFTVTPAPTPTPTPTPKPTPTPTRTPPPTPPPTQRPTAPPTQGPSVPPTRTPAPTVRSTPTPTPLPTPTPFVIGGGGGGSGGGSPQGGADCSAGIGRSPTPTELQADTAQLAAPGADPTTLEIQLLASLEYYRDAGGNDLGFVTRLYDDVLRHDPTPVEVATALGVVAGGADASRLQLVQNVVLSSEARAIRVDQAYHALLKTYPSSTDLAFWVNQLSGPGAPGVSGNVMVEKIASLPAYYTLVGGTATSFMIQLYQDLLNAPPTGDELTAADSLMLQIQSGSQPARLRRRGERGLQLVVPGRRGHLVLRQLHAPDLQGAPSAGVHQHRRPADHGATR